MLVRVVLEAVFVPHVLLQRRPSQHHLAGHLDCRANPPGQHRRQRLLEARPQDPVRRVEPHLPPDLEREQVPHGRPRLPHAAQEHGHQENGQHGAAQLTIVDQRGEGVGDHGQLVK